MFITLELGGSQGMRRNFSHSSCPFATLVISNKYLSGTEVIPGGLKLKRISLNCRM